MKNILLLCMLTMITSASALSSKSSNENILLKKPVTMGSLFTNNSKSNHLTCSIQCGLEVGYCNYNNQTPIQFEQCLEVFGQCMANCLSN